MYFVDNVHTCLKGVRIARFPAIHLVQVQVLVLLVSDRKEIPCTYKLLPISIQIMPSHVKRTSALPKDSQHLDDHDSTQHICTANSSLQWPVPPLRHEIGLKGDMSAQGFNYERVRLDDKRLQERVSNDDEHRLATRRKRPELGRNRAMLRRTNTKTGGRSPRTRMRWCWWSSSTILSDEVWEDCALYTCSLAHRSECEVRAHTLLYQRQWGTSFVPRRRRGLSTVWITLCRGPCIISSE